MHRTSKFGIKIDVARSHGSYLYDLNTGREVLDLFGLYSSLPLGYNHPAFDNDTFHAEVLRHAGVKITNCEMATDSAERFARAFELHPAMSAFTFFHYTTTGASAVDAAIKVAQAATKRRRILVLADSYHGISGVAGMLAAPGGPAWSRTKDYPQADFYCQGGRQTADWPMDLAAVIIEPIQCTAGDRVVDRAFLADARRFCTRTGIPLIFDEIQTGFGGTGTMWYFEQLGFAPDIVCFGKKAQVSGVMVADKFGAIFETPDHLEATWDGDLLDMIRCRAILGAYDRYDILANVKRKGKELATAIGARNVGLLLAMDFESKVVRDAFVLAMWHEESTIMLPTGDRTVRLRPNLAISDEECSDVVERFARARAGVGA
jgi:L-lysine 6-transaminase